MRPDLGGSPLWGGLTPVSPFPVLVRAPWTEEITHRVTQSLAPCCDSFEWRHAARCQQASIGGRLGCLKKLQSTLGREHIAQ